MAINKGLKEIARYLIKHTLLIDKNFDFKKYQTSLKKIYSKEFFQYWEACKEELDKIVIQEKSMTLHQFLTSPNGKILSEEINSLIDSSNFSIYQQDYVRHLNDRIVKETEMWSSEGIKLNYYVIKKIISYLSPNDKKNLLLAAKEAEKLAAKEKAAQTFIQNRNTTTNNQYSSNDKQNLLLAEEEKASKTLVQNICVTDNNQIINSTPTIPSRLRRLFLACAGLCSTATAQPPDTSASGMSSALATRSWGRAKDSSGYQ